MSEAIAIPEPVARRGRIHPRLWRRGHELFGRTYRGTIAENARRFRLVGKAYEAMPPEQNGYFDLASARHLAGPLRALQDPAVRIVMIIGATQVLKSVVGDIWVPYVMEHLQRNLLVLFEDDPKAKNYCEVRLMPTVKNHPAIADVLREDVDRFDNKKTFIKLPTSTTQVGGLNEGNVSTLSWPCIWISEAWQHKSDGLLAKAIKRADRFPHDAKILIESQPGLAGEDLEVLARTAHPVPLTWACPYCGGRQAWDFSRLRPQDFIPLPPLTFPPGELPLPVPPQPGTYSGMKFDAAEKTVAGKLVKVPMADRARSARWECYHCGAEIADTPPLRRQLAESYEQDYTIERDGFRFAPSVVCFYLPKEAHVTNSFEKSALAYLSAKEELDLTGNEIPYRDWWMAERARFWAKDSGAVINALATTPYDPESEFPNELCRALFVDVQKGYYWYAAFAIGSDFSIRQLAFDTALNTDDIFAVQQKWKIAHHRVFFDSHYEPEQTKQNCAKYRARVTLSFGRRQATKWVCWNTMVGMGREEFRSPLDELNHPVKYPPNRRSFPTPDGPVLVETYLFSNLICSDMARNYRDGVNAPAAEFLADDATKPEKLRWSQQVQAERRTEVRNEKTGKYEERWVRLRPENHGWDLLKMCMAFITMLREGQKVKGN